MGGQTWVMVLKAGAAGSAWNRGTKRNLIKHSARLHGAILPWCFQKWYLVQLFVGLFLFQIAYMFRHFYLIYIYIILLTLYFLCDSFWFIVNWCLAWTSYFNITICFSNIFSLHLFIPPLFSYKRHFKVFTLFCISYKNWLVLYWSL